MCKIEKYLYIGPGGKKCACCFPAPESKARKLEYRRAKRKLALAQLKDQKLEIEMSNDKHGGSLEKEQDG